MAFLAKQRQNSPSNVNRKLVNLVSRFWENILPNFLFIENNSAYRDLLEIFYLYRVTIVWKTYVNKILGFS